MPSKPPESVVSSTRPSDTPPVVERPLLLLDYDGTLAPFHEDPLQAYPFAGVSELLERLGRTHPLWIITGRRLADLEILLNLPLNAVGMHGAQEGVIGGDVHLHIAPDVEEKLRRLRAALPDIPGLRLEEKGPAFALHYRGAPNEDRMVSALKTWAADVPEGIDAIWGKKVLEMRPAGVTKGTAVRRLAKQHPGRMPVFLGDDVTDEEAFEALGDEAVTIKVGPEPTRARYRLPDIEAVVRYLQRYAG